MIRLLFLTLLLSTSASAQTVQTVSGRVVDAETSEPVVGAVARIDGTARGAAADGDGRFVLSVQPGDRTVVVSAIGYTPARLDVDALAADVRLAPADLQLDAVTVEGERAIAGDPSAPTRRPATTDDLLARLPGVTLIHRANFAAEPVVRGYQGGQVSLTIDGVPVYGACVDKMDPASSYVETENLAAVEVSRGAADLSHGSQIGGSIDLVTARPRFAQALTARGEVGTETNGFVRHVRGEAGWGTSRVALRASGSFRASGDYAPGGRDAIATSGYHKNNLAAAASLRLADGHTLTLQGIADDAWLVGYPALLMDAVLARARIASLTYDGRAPGLDRLSARLYRNRVDHTMDDRYRDVLQREVMRGMYMPMGGYADVNGGRVEAGRVLGRTQFALTADGHRLRQFGDMTMYSLYPGIRDMVLLNVGDARALNGALALEATRPLTGRLTVAASARVDATSRDVGREEARELFARRTGSADVARRMAVPSASATASYALSPRTRLHLTLADAGRLPTVVEQYGNYVYNYVDGYFYTGDPDLKPERSRQVELGIAHASPRIAVEASVYAHRLRDVVVGLADPDVLPGLSGSTYRFRLYDNVATGWMAGGEASALARLGVGISAVASVSAAFGQNVTFGEPLPMVPPVGGVAALRYDGGALLGGSFFGEVETRWALAQARVARFTYAERPTDGFAVASVRAGWQPHTGRAQGLRVQAGVENVFDTYYQEHLAISDLAARGRSAYLSLGIAL